MWVCENRTSAPYLAAGGCRHWRDDVAAGFTAAGFGRKRDCVYLYHIPGRGMDGHPGRLSGQPCADEGATPLSIPAGYIREGEPAVSGGYRRCPGARLSAGYRRLYREMGGRDAGVAGQACFVDQNDGAVYVADSSLCRRCEVLAGRGGCSSSYDRPACGGLWHGDDVFPFEGGREQRRDPVCGVRRFLRRHGPAGSERGVPRRISDTTTTL